MVKKELIIFIIFLLIFPIEIASYFSKSMGLFYIPAGLISYTLSILSLYVYIDQNKQIFLSRNSTVFVVLFLVFITLITISISTSKHSNILDFILPLKYFTYFLIGYLLHGIFKNKLYIKTIQIITILLAVFFIGFYQICDNNCFYNSFNYLRVSEAILFLFIISIVYSKTNLSKISLFLLAIFSLYYLNSRAAFYGFLLLTSIYIIKNTRLWKLLILLILFVLLLFPAIHYAEKNKDIRIFRILVNKKNDTSLNARNNMASNGLIRIKNNFIFGEYKGELETGKQGRYIHNILSYWSQFGLHSFLIFIILIIFSLLFLYLNKDKSKLYELILFLSIYTILTQLSLKSHLYFPIYIVLGLIISFQEEKYNKHSKILE